MKLSFIRQSWFRIVVQTLVLVVVMFLIFHNVIQNYHIQGSSMEPALHNSQYVLINKLAYLFQTPKRGDVVVFHNPNNPKENFVKRIIALPGDRISVVNNRVIVNGVELKESYISPANMINLYPPIVNYIIRDHSYFVMGDNRSNSSDSRQWGSLSQKYIVGKVAVVYWPLGQDNFGLLPDMSHVFGQIRK